IMAPIGRAAPAIAVPGDVTAGEFIPILSRPRHLRRRVSRDHGGVKPPSHLRVASPRRWRWADPTSHLFGGADPRTMILVSKLPASCRGASRPFKGSMKSLAPQFGWVCRPIMPLPGGAAPLPPSPAIGELPFALPGKSGTAVRFAVHRPKALVRRNPVPGQEDWRCRQ